MDFVTSDNTVDVTDARQTFEEVQPAARIRSGNPVHNLLDVYVQRLTDIDTTVEDLYDQKYIDTATGEELERLGRNVGVERKTGENDAKLRLRVKAGYETATSDGTYEDIAQTALIVLDADPSQVDIDTARDTADYATALVRANSSVISASPFTTAEIESLLSDAAVGGHRIILQATDVFTWDDANRGWGTVWGKHVE